MKCKDLLASLGDYLDGELDPRVYEAFREHLSCCGPCEVVIDNLRKTITVFKCGQEVELPPEMHDHLRGVLRKRWEAIFPQEAAG